MSKITRTKTKATGGITPDEKLRMDDHSKLWVERAFRTTPIEPDKIIPAIEGLYAVAGLKKPRVIIVPSPLVMAFAFGASAAILYGKKTATYSATDSATASATDSATNSATASATRSAKFDNGAAQACFELAGDFGIKCADKWGNAYEGGNMWSPYDCYLTACRDILGLELREHEGYKFWEQAAVHGGFRVMHEDFCMVSDFPEFIKIDEQNRPHCEDGPSHRWRDGWALYHWHGVAIPQNWVEQRKTIDPSEILKAKNTEQRAAGAALIGWPRMLSALESKIIDDSGNDDIGQLIEMTLPGLSEPGLFLKAKCPRNGIIVEGVPRISDIDNLPIKTALHAQAWRVGDPLSEYQHPLTRT